MTLCHFSTLLGLLLCLWRLVVSWWLMFVGLVLVEPLGQVVEVFLGQVVEVG